MPRRTGFSLIELLVVISIVAVIAALLLPAIQLAKLSANGAVCATNLRQFGLAFGLYLGDHEGIWPLTSWDPAGKTTNWEVLLEPYLGVDNPLPNLKVAHCPSAPTVTRAGSQLMVTYAFTAVWVNTYTGTSVWGAAYGQPYRFFPYWSYWWTGRPVHTLGNTVRLYEKCIISESWDDTTAGAYTGWRNEALTDMNTIRIHRQSANFLMADGHVQAINLPSYFKPMVRAQFQGNDYSDPMWFPRDNTASKLAR